MSYHIEKQFIPGLTQGNLIAPNFVVAHESGNARNTCPDSLEREISYMTRNWKNAFVSHWVGGGGRIVQLAETGKFQYGAGHKANPYSYAHVELARTDDKETFEKDYAAYVWLLRKLAKDAGIPVELDVGSTVNDKGIKSHDWIRRHIGGTSHVDPYGYLKKFGINREQFKADIEAGIEQVESSKVSAPRVEVKSQSVDGKIAYIQKTLNGRYSFNIKVDNLFGPETKKALIKAYQTELNKQFGAGLNVDGIWGPKTKAASVTIRKGAQGNLTWVLQAILVCYGFDIGVDGIFGSETEKAVKNFQGEEKLTVDGLPGKATFERLFN
ncbi:peptidoglycan recognition protein family protein [Oceanobacillus salinisoli]|uniref:peptidoglycan recognition protein family protein n=1 Tax=Oceanobacillus salinisoli TaxID=2678611 RepID=UPI0018CC16FD|nr:N-acetylmuramoyl-L-alanine amidase [Oceanobacillus salinisoli]